MRSSDKKGLLSVLLVGLVNGLIFIALLPAWQHYDEPAHFEYAWLLAARSRLPEAADFDPAMRQAVARSMIESGFFKRLTFAPDLDDPTGKVWIAPVTQLEDPPLYYLLAAAAMKPLDRQAILAQLYAGRLVSLGLFLLTLAIAWGVAAELTPPGSVMRWMLPLSMALLPGFADVMTSLNDSVGAVAFFSLFLCGTTRLVRRGFAWTTFLWTCAAALACLGMQASAFLAAPLLLVALLFSVLRGPRRKLAWIVSGAAGLLLLLAIFTWGDAALWFRQGPQPEATRARSQAAPLGKYAFAVHLEPGAAPAELAQLVPLAAGGALREQAFTLGAWMWTDRPGLYRTPRLATNLGKREYGESVWLDATPRFHAFTGITGKNTLRSWVLLAPASQAASTAATVYYDGVTLAKGIFSTDEAPSYAGSEASSGEWGDALFTNLVRNGSAESGWPQVRAQVEQIGAELLPHSGLERVSMAFYSLADPAGAGWYYRYNLGTLARTFWGKFAWGQVPLAGQKPYRWLGILTIAGLAGAGVWTWRQRRRIPWDIALLYGLAIAGVWGQALLRGSNYLTLPTSFQAVARYVYPTIIPCMLILGVGWREILGGIRRWLPGEPAWIYYLYPAFFALFDLYAIWSIWRYYFVM